MFRIVVPAIPIAQPRPRAAVCGQRAAVYHAKGPVDAFKATVRLAAAEVYRGPPLDGPVCVNLVFTFPRPKSMIWKIKPMPRLRHAKKPDRDNLDKAVLDALTGLMWRDDAQVCDGSITKWIAAGDEQPGVEITVIPLGQTPIGEIDE